MAMPELTHEQKAALPDLTPGGARQFDLRLKE